MAVLYRHIRLDSNQPFYIGIGKTEKRAYSKRGRNDHWHAVVNKHDYKVHIMLDDLTWEKACQKEIEFIQLYGRRDLGLGTLVNMTDGGEGMLGQKQSKETIDKRLTSNSGYKHTEEAKEKQRIAATGRKHTEETIEKCRKAATGQPRSEESNARRSATLKAYFAKKRIENAR